MSELLPTEEQGFPPIEDGIPVPHSRRGSLTDHFRKMQPGQSMFFADVTTVVLSNRISYIRKALAPAEFKVKKVDGGCRVWRVS